MLPLILLGAGLVLQGMGRMEANAAQAEAEEENAEFYREQAEFAEKAGERQRMIFDRESVILYGEQQSAFAKAGVDTSGSSYFMAQQMLYRTQEAGAIMAEADMNVRLATLRAKQSSETAKSLMDPDVNMMQFAGPILQAAGSAGVGGSSKGSGSLGGGTQVNSAGDGGYYSASQSAGDKVLGR